MACVWPSFVFSLFLRLFFNEHFLKVFIEFVSVLLLLYILVF